MKNIKNIEKDNGERLQDEKHEISPIFSVVFVRACVRQYVRVR